MLDKYKTQNKSQVILSNSTDYFRWKLNAMSKFW